MRCRYLAVAVATTALSSSSVASEAAMPRLTAETANGTWTGVSTGDAGVAWAFMLTSENHRNGTLTVGRGDGTKMKPLLARLQVRSVDVRGGRLKVRCESQ